MRAETALVSRFRRGCCARCARALARSRAQMWLHFISTSRHGRLVTGALAGSDGIVCMGASVNDNFQSLVGRFFGQRRHGHDEEAVFVSSLQGRDVVVQWNRYAALELWIVISEEQ